MKETQTDTMQNFVYWIEKNLGDDFSKRQFTHSQIAQIIGKAMINFFNESDTNF